MGIYYYHIYVIQLKCAGDFVFVCLLLFYVFIITDVHQVIDFKY